MTRTLVAGPRYLLDVLELSAPEEHLVELPWHPSVEAELLTPGRWEAEPAADEFVSAVERFVPDVAGPVLLRTCDSAGKRLSLHFDGGAVLLRASGPGLPGSSAPATFYLQRARGAGVSLVAVAEVGAGEPLVRSVRVTGGMIEVETAEGSDRHANVSDGWDVGTDGGTVALRGLRRAGVATPRPLIDPDRRTPVRGVALHTREVPTLDGTLDWFDLAEPLVLDYEDQYRRSEEPYAGPEEFSALAAASWDDAGLYVGVQVTKAELLVRHDPTPLRLDNEPDEIHADGVQIYVRPSADGPIYGFLVVPSSEDGEIRVRGVRGTAGDPSMVRGAWRPGDSGFTLSLALALPQWHPRTGGLIGFDLLVNRMEPGRERRSGQLVWSGGGGWVYLRGDRQEAESFGVLELR